MLKETVLAHFGGSVQRTADAIGVTRSAVYQWKDGEPIPAESALKVQAATRGKLKVDPALYASVA